MMIYCASKLTILARKTAKRLGENLATEPCTGRAINSSSAREGLVKYSHREADQWEVCGRRSWLQGPRE